MTMEEHSRDSMSQRRRLLTGEDRRAFDKYYGRPKGSRCASHYGKGDQFRSHDEELYALGWAASFAPTPEERAAASEEWTYLYNLRFGNGEEQDEQQRP